MPATVLQVNASAGGVPKLPIPQGEVTHSGLAQDRHAHPSLHGGARQALLLITAEGTEELRCAGFPVFDGALGENITTQGLRRQSVRIGQRYRIGAEVVVEITKVRAPCDTLNVYGAGTIQKAVYDAGCKARDASSTRWGLSGFYASVVHTGVIRPGDPVTLLDQLV